MIADIIQQQECIFNGQTLFSGSLKYGFRELQRYHISGSTKITRVHQLVSELIQNYSKTLRDLKNCVLLFRKDSEGLNISVVLV